MLVEHPLAPGSKVLVEEEVLGLVRQFRQLGHVSAEAGGILMGYRRGDHLHVVSATVPGPQDLRERNGFVRRDPLHQARATLGWRRSGGRLDYLGEWHTHAQVLPQPSSLDVDEWRNVCKVTGQPMVFLIVGLEDCWLGVGDGLRLAQAGRARPQGEHQSKPGPRPAET